MKMLRKLFAGAARLHDPLHALKAMTDDERLALFS